MFFGGVNGFNTFFPDSVMDNPHVPTVVLTGFKKFDVPVQLVEDISLAPEVRLAYDESVFSIEFAALEFSNPVNNRYAYKMEGVDKDWVYTHQRREARYTNLDAGNYLFQVKGTNNDEVWNESATLLHIVIVPPFWRTGWFIGLMALAGVGAFGATVWFISTQKLKKKIEKLEREKAIREDRLRTRERIARDLHDDLASTVGSAGLFVESVKNQLKDIPLQTKEFLDKTSSLLTEAEDSMSDIVWSVSPKNDTLESLLARMRLSTADICRPRQIKYEIAFVENAGSLTVVEEIRRNIFLLFKEALTNAVRHSEATAIKIGFALSGERFELTVEDNGKGMPSLESPSVQTKRGHGLRNMAKRAEEIQASFSIERGATSGTVVRLRGSLPTGRQE
jgi:signal transduction histidine kinase